MAHHEFLRRLGLFTYPEFFSEEECARWRKLADTSPGTPARVYGDGGAQVDESRRKTVNVVLQDEEKRKFDEKIGALRGEIGRHFEQELGGLDQARCLMYRPGDFFVLHADTSAVDGKEFDYVTKRSVSVVIFLNEPNHPTASYGGGELSFFGLLDVPHKAQYGFPVDAETGLLVAFPSEMLHEVSEVTGGNRYTMVNWIFKKERIGDEDADYDDVHMEA